jgi:aryl-alcohol dehydrogenase-like predicted oxidoreductase
MPPLGRTKTGRHRPVALEEDPQAPGRELEDYLAALAPDTDVETTGTGRRFGNAQVYQLRLPLAANEQLRELAEAAGTSPLSLAQEWVMQRLGWEAEQRAARVGAATGPAWPE